MSGEKNEERIRMEVYLEMMITILKIKPHFITTIPKKGAMKILLLLALEENNNDLSEKLISNLADKHGESFLDEMEEVLKNPSLLINDIEDKDE